MSGARTVIRADRLWSGERDAIVTPAVVAIAEGRIEYAGRPRPEDVPDVDLGDATLLPGFIDAHLHLSDDGWFPRELLACGITTVRDTGNNHHALIALRERQEAGDWLGPRIRTFGPLLDGPPGHWRHVARPLAASDDIERRVDDLIADGVDGLKTYVRTEPEVVERVVRRGAERGIPVTCHCGACRASQALGYGMGCIEHVTCLDALPDGADWSEFDRHSDQFRRIVDLFGETGARFCPTLATMEAVEHGWGPAFQASPGYDRYPAHVAAFLRATGGGDHWEADCIRQASAAFDCMLDAVNALYDAGVPLMAGSDSPFVPPGVGFLTELELLSKAGLSNADVLRTATTEPARYLGLDGKVGTLEAGNAADIVAVVGDPLRDIANVRRIAAIWQRGEQLNPRNLRAEASGIAQSLLPPRDVPPWGIPYPNIRPRGEGEELR